MLAIEAKTIISDALAQALECMAFLDALPACQDDMELPAPAVAAEIGFSGTVTGAISMIASKEFAAMFAENMSGMEDIEDDQCIDAIQELLNVTCGLVIPMVSSDPACEFDLTVPHLIDEPDNWQEFLSRDDVAVIDIEDHLVAVRLAFDS